MSKGVVEGYIFARSDVGPLKRYFDIDDEFHKKGDMYGFYSVDAPSIVSNDTSVDSTDTTGTEYNVYRQHNSFTDNIKSFLGFDIPKKFSFYKDVPESILSNKDITVFSITADKDEVECDEFIRCKTNKFTITKQLNNFKPYPNYKPQ